MDIGPYSIIPDNEIQLDNLDLVRRHSQSLRTPPYGSLADDILRNSHVQLRKVQDMMTDVKETLSDFGSCYESASSKSSSSSSSGSEAERSGSASYKTVGMKKTGKKRKSSLTPSRGYFMKKSNTASSPQ